MLKTIVRSVLNHYPFHTPRASILKMLPPTPLDYGPFGIPDGLTINAYPTNSSDHVVKSLFWLGSFDPWVCSTLKSLIIPGTTALDIGANIGLMTLMMAQTAGSETKIHSFEPSPDTCARLRSNIATNSMGNVEIHELALSNQSGQCRLVVPDNQEGMARIGEQHEGQNFFDVPMITFDEWATDRELDHISVCKIDVEGHEPQVLSGMRQTLSAGMIDAIVFEDHAAPSRSQTQAILRGHGFEILRMYKSPRTIHYVKIGEGKPGSPTADYVAVRPGSEAEARLKRTP